MIRRTVQFLRTALLCCMAALALAVIGPQALAMSGTCNGDDNSNVTWTLDDEGTLTIRGTGTAGRFQSPDFSGALKDFQEGTRSMVIEEGVTNINSDVSFWQFGNLKSITAPASCKGDIGWTNVIYLRITGSGVPQGKYTVGADATVDIDEGVTGLRDNAFSYAQLAHIRIPSTLTSIGVRAFEGCKNLKTINLLTPPAFDEALKNITSLGFAAFKDCEGLTGELTLPKRLTALGQETFANCTGLSGLVIPDNITDVGSAFSGCSEITSFNLHESVSGFFGGCTATAYVKIRPSADAQEVQMPVSPWYSASLAGHPVTVELEEGITEIRDEMFSGCANVTVKIPDSVKRIGKSAFAGCKSITQFNLKNITEIGASAFKGAGLRGELVIPDGVSKIGESAFSECAGLTSIVIPDGVSEIGSSAFSECAGLTSIVIPDSVSEIGSGAFSKCVGVDYISVPGAALKNDAFSGVEASRIRVTGSCVLDGYHRPWSGRRTKDITIEIADGITEIGKSTFAECATLVEVTIPDSVSVVGEGAFRDCSGLKTIPNLSHVTAIGEYAFLGCAGLTGELTLPESLETIGSNAFRGCAGLTSVVIPDAVKAETLSLAFAECVGLESVTVPAALVGSFGYGCTGVASVKVTGSGDMNNDGLTDIQSDYYPWASSLEKGHKVTVEFPEGLTSIGKYAFRECSGDLNVNIPANVSRIEDYAFYQCSAVKELDPSAWTYVGERAFEGATGIVMKPDFAKLAYVGAYAFKDCAWLEGEPVFRNEESLTVGVSAFENCSGLSGTLDLPACAELGYETFKNCAGLTGVAFSLRTAHTNSFGGCVGLVFTRIKADSSSFYVGGKNTPWMIGSEAGNNVTVEIEEGPTQITEKTFQNCANLTSVSIPKSVRYVTSSAFEGCNKLAEVRYAGTRKDWQSVRISDGNDPLGTAQIIYENSTGELTLEGISFGNTSVRVDVSDIPEEGKTVFCAAVAYTSEGKFIGADYKEITEGRVKLYPKRDGAAVVRAFLVDENFRVLADVMEQKISA